MSVFNSVKRRLLLVIMLVIPTYVYSAELKFITLEVTPWAYPGRDENKYLGIFPDLVKELKGRTGHDIAITLTPYARIDHELETGRQDCTMLIREKKRENIIFLGELIFNHAMGIVAHKSFPLKDYKDLYGLKISVLRALSITEQFTNDSLLRKEFDTDYEMGLRKIKHGRLNAIAGAIPTIQYLAKKNGLSDLLGEPLQLSLEPIYLQCSKNSKNLQYIDSINRAIREIKKDGVLDAIIDKYS